MYCWKSLSVVHIWAPSLSCNIQGAVLNYRFAGVGSTPNVMGCISSQGLPKCPTGTEFFWNQWLFGFFKVHLHAFYFYLFIYCCCCCLSVWIVLHQGLPCLHMSQETLCPQRDNWMGPVLVHLLEQKPTPAGMRNVDTWGSASGHKLFLDRQKLPWKFCVCTYKYVYNYIIV